MTRDDIIHMARTAGLQRIYGACAEAAGESSYEDWDYEIERFAELIAAAEREAIAQMIEDAPPLVDFAKNEQDGCIVCGFTPKLAALTIRARGQKCN